MSHRSRVRAPQGVFEEIAWFFAAPRGAPRRADARGGFRRAKHQESRCTAALWAVFNPTRRVWLIHNEVPEVSSDITR